MDKEEIIKEQMEGMLADQWYHQPGPVIQIAREALVDMLTKQTMHGIEIGHEEAKADALAKTIKDTATELTK